MTVAELGEAAAERFLRYVQIDTQSDPTSDLYPSTPGQLELLRLLLHELIEIGLEDAAIDDHGYVTASLPGTAPDAPTIGFFAHVDTTPDVTGACVSPRRIRYDGGDIVLGSSGEVISPSTSPELARHVGHEIITSDGTTLLGADDKAGIAEIMAAVAYLIKHPDLPRAPLKVAFTPDEEIARGVAHFPVNGFGATAAYTVDGSTAGEIQDETFSAAQVILSIRGRPIHPGWAKDRLVNAIKVAAAIIDELPEDRLSPETTEGRDGYVHPISIGGDAATVVVRFLVRDFETYLLDEHIAYLKRLATDVAQRVGASVDVESHTQYQNMRKALQKQRHIIENLETAIRRIGLEPRKTAFRAGTDGAFLTEMGLPTANVFAGWQDAHSEREWICVEDMGLAAATIVELARVWAENGVIVDNHLGVASGGQSLDGQGRMVDPPA